MKAIVRFLFGVIITLYTGFLFLWLLLHQFFGDHLWWLAILSTFTPFFFVPLLVLLPLALVIRRRSFFLPVLACLLLFLVLYSPYFLPAWPHPVLKAPTPLTLMTFNSWGGSQTQSTAQVLTQYGTPDVVLLQELSPALADIFSREWRATYPYQILHPARGAAGMGVLSRYPLQELHLTGLQQPDSYLQVVQLQYRGEYLTIYNCHAVVTNPLLSLENGTSLAADVERSFRQREVFIRGVVMDVAQRQGASIVAGDFNSTDQHRTYALLTEQLTDSHQEAGWGFQHTFPAYWGSVRGIPTPPREMRIDMVFYSDKLVALEHDVGKEYGESDHLPVLVTLGWKQAP